MVEVKMENQAAYEQTLLSIVRSLPPGRLVELLDFARFLQTLANDPAEEKWDQLLARPEAQRTMVDMAREAREDFRAGRTTDIGITKDGRLAPK